LDLLLESPVKRILLPLAATAALGITTPAQAGEIFGGLYVHDIESPLSKSGVEEGTDVQLGWRGGNIGKTPLQPYAFAAVNTAGQTHYAAVGISAKLGDRFFIRPGLGLAVHTGSAAKTHYPTDDDIEFGSRILFEPELGIGARINDRMTIEASWVHMSHATLFSDQNPGIDNVGIRLSYKLP
jgi:lipid A 3-O-deacylase